MFLNRLDKMQFFVITAFPEIFRSPLEETILMRAQKKDLLKVDVVDIKEFAEGKHHHIDDYPYGGGAGMVLKPEPIARAIESIEIDKTKNTRSVYMSPRGEPLTQKKLEYLKEFDNLVILCGRYKGVDQRIVDSYIDEDISIGDYVLSGGEIPALVLIDGVTRLIPGVLGNIKSSETDSFTTGLLGYPTYTRPVDWEGKEVPEILLSGDHAKIAKWRLEECIRKTAEKRKDLLEKYLLEIEDRNE